MARPSLPKNFSIDNLQFVAHSTHYKFMDLTGRRFTRWLVLGYAGYHSAHSWWWCRCDCGSVRQVRLNVLRRGSSQSCGCLAKEVHRSKQLTHGQSKSTEYKIWVGMITRCCNPKASGYYKYGAKGITVCPRWRKFENFLEDTGPRPSHKHSLDRIDNNGHYDPSNVRWTTAITQQCNTSRNVYATLNSRTQTISQWCRELNLCPSAVQRRRKKGMTTEAAISDLLKVKKCNYDLH